MVGREGSSSPRGRWSVLVVLRTPLPAVHHRVVLAPVVVGLVLALAATPAPWARGQAPTVLADLAPTGELRAAIIVNQPAYATRNPTTGELRGVTIDLGRELAARLGVPFVPVEYAGQAGIVADLEAGRVDIAFLAITADPERARVLDFTPPFFETESTYLVPPDSPLQSLADVDQPGVRVVVVQGAALDVLLTETLAHAEVVRVSATEAIAVLRAGQADAYAANRTTLLGVAEQWPGARVLEERLAATPSGMAIVKGRPAALAYLTAFIEEVKASGFVQEAIDRAGLRGVPVAPPASRTGK